MNFIEYTFKGSFGYYAAIASVLTAVVMLVLFSTGNNPLAWIIFFAFTTLLKISITGSYLRWRAYRKRKREHLIYGGYQKRAT